MLKAIEEAKLRSKTDDDIQVCLPNERALWGVRHSFAVRGCSMMRQEHLHCINYTQHQISRLLCGKLTSDAMCLVAMQQVVESLLDKHMKVSNCVWC